MNNKLEMDQIADIKANDLVEVEGNVERRLNEFQIIVNRIKKLEGEKNDKE